MAKTKKLGFKELDAKLDRIIGVLVTKADTTRIDNPEKRIDERFQKVLLAIDKLTLPM